MADSFDVIVLGGGPAGTSAALRCAQLGLRTGLIENSLLGGTCLNCGCIPTKTLLHSVDLYQKILKADEWGIDIGGLPQWNLDKLFQKKEYVVSRLRQGLELTLKKKLVTYINAHASLLDPTTVLAGSETFKARFIVIATGAIAWIPEVLGDRQKVWTSSNALERQIRVPLSMGILGAGPEGCELAEIYAMLGSKVTLIEAKEKILPAFDPEATEVLVKAMAAKDIRIITGSFAKEIVDNNSGKEIILSDGRVIAVEHVLVSVGRVPNSRGLGLEKAGVLMDKRGFIQTNDNFETNIHNIYAVGDVNGKSMMAHSATLQGLAAAEVIAGHEKSTLPRVIPSCVYTHPELAQAGLSEAEVARRTLVCEIKRFPFIALGRSHAKGQTGGFVKLIADKATRQILGATIVGDAASEIINLITFAIQNKKNMEDLKNHIAPHPSAAEAVSEAAHLFY